MLKSLHFFLPFYFQCFVEGGKSVPMVFNSFSRSSVSIENLRPENLSGQKWQKYTVNIENSRKVQKQSVKVSKGSQTFCCKYEKVTIFSWFQTNSYILLCVFMFLHAIILLTPPDQGGEINWP